MSRFYGHFAAAYGTIWFVMMLAAVFSQSHVNAGAFGFCGFPIIALIYAFLRSNEETSETLELIRLRDRVRDLESQLLNKRIDYP